MKLIKSGEKWARFDPYDGFKLTFSIVFNHPAIDRTGQEVTIDFSEHSYVREVARARTFRVYAGSRVVAREWPGAGRWTRQCRGAR